MRDVLLLNADYSPLSIVAWQRAVCLLLDQRVRAVAEYDGAVIRSPSLEIAWPAVVSLVEYVCVAHGPCLNRMNVLARDQFTCQYCGHAPRTRTGRPVPHRLTLDHVVPRCRSHAGRVTLPWERTPVPVTSWQNLVAACPSCNGRKGGRTPEEAGMQLRRRPRVPGRMDAIRIALARVQVPDEWHDYLPRACLA